MTISRETSDQIVSLLAKGLTAPQIGRELNINRRTVYSVAAGTHPHQRLKRKRVILPSGSYRLCEGCGYHVLMPCLACRARKYRIKASHLDAPLAELERYGFPVRLINSLEKHFGALYVRDLEGVTPEKLRRLPGWHDKSVRQFWAALKRLRRGLPGDGPADGLWEKDAKRLAKYGLPQFPKVTDE